MSRNDPMFSLRMPSEIKDMLTFLAKQNGRSINAEMLGRITHTLTLTDIWEFAESTGIDESERQSWVIDFAKQFGISTMENKGEATKDQLAAIKSEVFNEIVILVKEGIKQASKDQNG